VRRIESLEARLLDETGLAPHSDAWFRCWVERVDRLGKGDDLSAIPDEVLTFVIERKRIALGLSREDLERELARL